MNSRIPIFRQALQSQWDGLAPVIQAHYGLVPFSEETLRVQGCMDTVSHSRLAGLMIPVTSFVGALVPYQGQNIPVVLVNSTRQNQSGLYWQRTFFFPNRKPFLFRSVMRCTGPQEITEYVRYGFGIRFEVFERNGGIIYHDRGYVWQVGKVSMPVPVGWMMGKAYIEEMPISETQFSINMVLTHPLFGQTFQYNGKFTIGRCEKAS